MLPDFSSKLDLLEEDKLRLLAKDSILNLVLKEVLYFSDLIELSVRKLKLICKYDWLNELIENNRHFREQFIGLSEDSRDNYLKYIYIFENETFTLIAENEGLEEAIDAYRNLQQKFYNEEIFDKIDEIYDEFVQLVDAAADDYKFASILANRTFSTFVRSYRDASDYESESEFQNVYEEDYDQEFDEDIERLTQVSDILSISEEDTELQELLLQIYAKSKQKQITLPSGFTDVASDGFCFYHAIAELLNDGITANEVQAEAINEILTNSENYMELLPGINIAGLNTTSMLPKQILRAYLTYHLQHHDQLTNPWADDLMIRATANALGVNIQANMFNLDGTPQLHQNGERIGQNIVLKFTSQTNLTSRTLIIGNIANLHFVKHSVVNIDLEEQITSINYDNKDDDQSGGENDYIGFCLTEIVYDDPALIHSLGASK